MRRLPWSVSFLSVSAYSHVLALVSKDVYLLASPALPDAGRVALHSGLAAEGAAISGVL